MCDFYYAYCGGKRTEYIHIKEYVARFVADGGITFVEPFCGSCATSLKVSKDFAVNFHVNDISKYHIRMLTHIKEKGTSQHLFHYTNIKNQGITPEIFKQGIDADKKELATIEEQFYYCKMYSVRKYVWGNGLVIIDRVKNHNPNHALADKFFTNATITCSDYTDILAQYHDDPTACLYLDPPYLDSANTGYVGYNSPGAGEIPDNTKMYVDFISFFDTCKCKFIMIINSNCLNQYLYAPYIESSYVKKYATALANGGKRLTSHLIITNLASPL